MKPILLAIVGLTITDIKEHGLLISIISAFVAGSYMPFYWGYRDWVLKNYKTFLFIAIYFALLGYFLGFWLLISYHIPTPLGAFVGPLVSLVSYRIVYIQFEKIYGRPMKWIYIKKRDPENGFIAVHFTVFFIATYSSAQLTHSM